MIKKFLDKIVFFSTRLLYAIKKIRVIFYSLINTTYNSTDDMINKLQQLKCKTNVKFYKNKSNYYDEMSIKNFRFEEDLFSKNAQSISKVLS